MARISRKLTYSEVNYGLLWVSQLRNMLPSPPEPVTVLDTDGQKYISKLHSQNPRIDGLTELHQKHHSIIGQIVSIEVTPDDPSIAKVFFEEDSTKLPEPTNDTSEEITTESDPLYITASLESMLEDFIANNLSTLEPHLRLFKDEDGIPGRQYATEVGTIDLLCVDENNNLVVVELKKGRESDKVVGQISRYIGWVKSKIAKDSRDVRGIVVVHKPTDTYPKDDRLEYAILSNPRLQLKYYEISLRFL
jgi:hypothetical protein